MSTDKAGVWSQFVIHGQTSPQIRRGVMPHATLESLQKKISIVTHNILFSRPVRKNHDATRVNEGDQPYRIWSQRDQHIPTNIDSPEFGNKIHDDIDFLETLMKAPGEPQGSSLNRDWCFRFEENSHRTRLAIETS